MPQPKIVQDAGGMRLDADAVGKYRKVIRWMSTFIHQKRKYSTTPHATPRTKCRSQALAVLGATSYNKIIGVLLAAVKRKDLPIWLSPELESIERTGDLCPYNWHGHDLLRFRWLPVLRGNLLRRFC